MFLFVYMIYFIVIRLCFVLQYCYLQDFIICRFEAWTYNINHNYILFTVIYNANDLTFAILDLILGGNTVLSMLTFASK